VYLLNDPKIVSIVKSKPFTTSIIIAEGVGSDHKPVIQLVRKHKQAINRLGTSDMRMRKFKTKGRDGELAELSEEQSVFLVTLMGNSPTVVKFKEAMVEEFFSQKKRLSSMGQNRKADNWIESRSAGKLVHRNLTDKIKEFAEYAASHGSENCEMYFVVIPKMINRMLFNKSGDDFNSLRQFLTAEQLANIATAEKVAIKALTEGMGKNLEYKEVYKLADDKVAAFADIVGTSEIMGVLPEQKLLLG